MRKVIGVITARMASTRLPGKVLKEIADKTNFAHHVERMSHVKGLDGIFLATSNDPLNESLIEEAERLRCGWYAGSEQDVVERHVVLCEREGADAVIRVTCDCPIFNIESTSRFVEEFQKEFFDYIYVSNMSMINGTLSELISYKALFETHKHYKGPGVSMFVRENINKFKTLGIEIENDLCRPEYRLTVDEPADLDLIRNIYSSLYKGEPLDLREVYVWLDDNPEIGKINQHVGLKAINIYGANLMENPIYSIVPSGKGYVILDKNKRNVEPSEFINIVQQLFKI